MKFLLTKNINTKIQINLLNKNNKIYFKNSLNSFNYSSKLISNSLSINKNFNRENNLYQISANVKNFSQFQDTKQLKLYRKRKLLLFCLKIFYL
jgi:hypothetical protein